MKMSMLIGFLGLGAGLAGMSTPAHAAKLTEIDPNLAGGPQVEDTFVPVQDVRVTVAASTPAHSAKLTEIDPNLAGGLQVGDADAPTRNARATVAGVRFEVPGEGIFAAHAVTDNSVRASPFGDAITSSGP